MGCQTDSLQQYVDMMNKAENLWENCLNTVTRLKFEELRDKHHMEVQELCREIKREKLYREEQCRKVFEQWHENISLKCFLQTTVKLPEWCLGGSKSKGLDKDILETD